MPNIKSTNTQLKLQLQAALPKLKKSPRYHVVLINDDYTPMDFVVEILERFFYKDHAAAIELMLQIHTQGKTICGTYPHEIAETKAALVNDYSQLNQHPLMCIIEPAAM